MLTAIRFSFILRHKIKEENGMIDAIKLKSQGSTLNKKKLKIRFPPFIKVHLSTLIILVDSINVYETTFRIVLFASAITRTLNYVLKYLQSGRINCAKIQI